MPRDTGPSVETRSGTPPFPARDAAIHDMANLLDAALRSIGAARREADPRRALPALEAALVQMGDLLSVLAGSSRRKLPSEAGLSVFDAVEHAVELMRVAAQEHGVTLEATPDERLRGYTAPGLLRALTDAVRNAVESISLARCAVGGPAGVISVRAAIDGANIRIEVADNGGGPPDWLMEPLYPRHSSKSGATGLGLVVACHIVERLRGSVSLERGSGTAPGRPGAALKFLIPLDALALSSTPSDR